MEGTLKIPVRTLNLRGAATYWMKGLKHKEEDIWNQKEDEEREEANTMMQVLRHVTCPVCDTKKDMETYKVYGGKVGFARIKCMKCNSINTADKWRCSCKLLWQKCNKHIVKAQEHALDELKRPCKRKDKRSEEAHNEFECRSKKIYTSDKKRNEDDGYDDAGSTEG